MQMRRHDNMPDDSHYSRARESLYFLLGAPPTAHVLSVGALPGSWQRSSAHTDIMQTLGKGKHRERDFDLILYHSGSAKNAIELTADLKRLKNMSAQGGALIIFGESPVFASPLKRLLHRSVAQSCSREKVRQAMASAGLTADKVFVTGSTLENAEEFSSVDRSGTAYTTSAQPDRENGYAIYVSSQQIEDSSLFRAVERQIVSDQTTGASSLKLERFILRQRGAFILFTCEQLSGRKYVSRLVTDDETDRIVRRNHAFLHYLHGTGRLLPVDRRLLPIPIGQARFHGCTILTESRLSGVLAWTVCRGRLEKTIYRQATDFVLRLQVAMNRPTYFSRQNLPDLFAADLKLLELYTTQSPELIRNVRALVKLISSRLLERHGCLVASHGDYGYGNILISAQDGTLSGAIDWDTGRKAELPGVDLLNLRIQKHRIERNSSFYPAFRQVMQAIQAEGGIDREGIYADQFGVTDDMPGVTLAVTLLRYMSRAAQYPEVFNAELDDYQNALRLFLKSEA